MNRNNALLTIRFDGEAVGPGVIPVAHLLRFLDGMNKALLRTGRILMGEADSVRRGPHPRTVRDEVALELVSLTHGSPAAVMGFQLRRSEAGLPGMDLGLETLEKAVSGLCAVQKLSGDLPMGFDAGVLMAWRDAGSLFSQGISTITLALNHRESQLTTTFTPEGYSRLQERIAGPRSNVRTIEGRLLMVDFKEHGTRCRVHPSVGEPVLCLFNEEQKDEVLEDILQFVRIVGEAKEDPVTGRIATIRIHDIERLEDRDDDTARLLPQGTPVGRDFWESPTLDELAEAQSVRPMANVRALFGTWPGEINDCFEDDIDDLRHGVSGTGRRA